MGVLVLMGAHFTKPSTLNGVCTVQVGKMPKEQEARVGGGGVVSQTARLLMQRGSDWPLLAPSLSLAVY